MPAPEQYPSAGVSEEIMFRKHLQEYTQKASLAPPVYQTFVEGAQPYHFRSHVWVNGSCFKSPNLFPNKKMAEQDAAKQALVDILEKVKNNFQYTALCKSIVNEMCKLIVHDANKVKSSCNYSPGGSAHGAMNPERNSGAVLSVNEKNEVHVDGNTATGSPGETPQSSLLVSCNPIPIVEKVVPESSIERASNTQALSEPVHALEKPKLQASPSVIAPPIDAVPASPATIPCIEFVPPVLKQTPTLSPCKKKKRKAKMPEQSPEGGIAPGAMNPERNSGALLSVNEKNEVHVDGNTATGSPGETPQSSLLVSCNPIPVVEKVIPESSIERASNTQALSEPVQVLEKPKLQASPSVIAPPIDAARPASSGTIPCIEFVPPVLKQAPMQKQSPQGGTAPGPMNPERNSGAILCVNEKNEVHVDGNTATASPGETLQSSLLVSCNPILIVEKVVPESSIQRVSHTQALSEPVHVLEKPKLQASPSVIAPPINAVRPAATIPCIESVPPTLRQTPTLSTSKKRKRKAKMQKQSPQGGTASGPMNPINPARTSGAILSVNEKNEIHVDGNTATASPGETLQSSLLVSCNPILVVEKVVPESSIQRASHTQALSEPVHALEKPKLQASSSVIAPPINTVRPAATIPCIESVPPTLQQTPTFSTSKRRKRKAKMQKQSPQCGNSPGPMNPINPERNTGAILSVNQKKDFNVYGSPGGSRVFEKVVLEFFIERASNTQALSEPVHKPNLQASQSVIAPPIVAVRPASSATIPCIESVPPVLKQAPTNLTSKKRKRKAKMQKQSLQGGNAPGAMNPERNSGAILSVNGNTATGSLGETPQSSNPFRVVKTVVLGSSIDRATNTQALSEPVHVLEKPKLQASPSVIAPPFNAVRPASSATIPYIESVPPVLKQAPTNLISKKMKRKAKMQKQSLQGGNAPGAMNPERNSGAILSVNGNTAKKRKRAKKQKQSPQGGNAPGAMNPERNSGALLSVNEKNEVHVDGNTATGSPGETPQSSLLVSCNPIPVVEKVVPESSVERASNTQALTDPVHALFVILIFLFGIFQKRGT